MDEDVTKFAPGEFDTDVKQLTPGRRRDGRDNVTYDVLRNGLTAQRRAILNETKELIDHATVHIIANKAAHQAMGAQGDRVTALALMLETINERLDLFEGKLNALLTAQLQSPRSANRLSPIPMRDQGGGRVTPSGSAKSQEDPLPESIARRT